jgi:hypothetical protein
LQPSFSELLKCTLLKLSENTFFNKVREECVRERR